MVLVTHDPALNPDITRDATGRWVSERVPIRHLTEAALASYDVGRIRPGSAYAGRFPDQVPVDGARMPTLAAVLALDPAIRVNIELKSQPDSGMTVEGPVMAAAVADVLGPAAARVIVQSFDWSGLRHLRQHRPDVALAWLTERAAGDAAARVVAEGGTTWAPDHESLTRALLDDAHARGLRVIPWTVNDPADMRRLIAWGVDGLITDRPDRARPLR